MVRLSVPLPTKEQYATIISAFLENIGFTMPREIPDHSLTEPVVSHFSAQEWDDAITAKAIKRAKFSAVGLAFVYPFVPKDHKIAYAIFSTYMFLIDDSDAELIPGLDEFAARMMQGLPQESPVLNSMVKFIGEMSHYFGPYSHAMISKSMVEFIGSRVVENRYNKVMVPPRGATKFPEYFRQRSGIPEPYAQFAFPEELYPEETFLSEYLPILPDMADFVSLANDLLSFYKETMTGCEELNYICNLAQVHDISALEALRITSDNAVQCIKNIRAVLAQSVDPGMRDTTEQFIQGYVGGHIGQPRYKLADLLGHV